jgi:hypothetical protein
MGRLAGEFQYRSGAITRFSASRKAPGAADPLRGHFRNSLLFTDIYSRAIPQNRSLQQDGKGVASGKSGIRVWKEKM